MRSMKHIAALAVLGLGLSAAPAQARNDFLNGFEDQLGRLAAHAILGAGVYAVTHPAPVYYADPGPVYYADPAPVRVWVGVPQPRVHVYTPAPVYYPVVVEHHHHHGYGYGHPSHRQDVRHDDHRGRRHDVRHDDHRGRRHDVRHDDHRGRHGDWRHADRRHRRGRDFMRHPRGQRVNYGY